jgi:hypothetical protein
MKYFIDEVINLMFDYTTTSNSEEMKEQGSAAPAASTGGGAGGSTSYPSVPKWAEIVGGPKRGPANMLGAEGEVWSSDLQRGVANQIW